MSVRSTSIRFFTKTFYSRNKFFSACYELWRYLGGVHAHLLPTPMMNIMNGGAHANNALDVQEFMIMPVGAPHFGDALRMGAEIFHVLKSLLSDAGMSTAVGDEGGFAPAINSSDEALDYITRAIETAGYKPGDDVMIALDAAASEFCEEGAYHLAGEGRTLSTTEMNAMWEQLVKNHPIISLEDPLHEDDWDGFTALPTSLIPTAECDFRLMLFGGSKLVSKIML